MRAHYGEHIVQCMGCGNPVQVLLLAKHARVGTYHNPGCLRRLMTAAKAARMIAEIEGEEGGSADGESGDRE